MTTKEFMVWVRPLVFGDDEQNTLFTTLCATVHITRTEEPALPTHSRYDLVRDILERAMAVPSEIGEDVYYEAMRLLDERYNDGGPEA